MNMEQQITYQDIAKALNIQGNRYEYIISYTIQMIKDYRGNVTDIIKEVPLNLKKNERYFSMFVLGNSAYPDFSEQDAGEKERFITNIIGAMKLNKERAESISEDIENTIIRDTKEGEDIPSIDMIKKIIDGNFKDSEKDYALFILGMTYS